MKTKVKTPRLTVNELIAQLQKIAENGKGDTSVVLCSSFEDEYESVKNVRIDTALPRAGRLEMIDEDCDDVPPSKLESVVVIR